MAIKNLPIPSGVVTGVGIFAVVGIVAVAGVALRAGILIGQTSRKHADKLSAETGEWVEPNIPAAVTDAIGRFVARTAVKGGKKAVMFGAKKASKTIGAKFNIPSNVTSTVPADLAKILKRAAEKAKSRTVIVDDEPTKVFEAEDLLLTVDEILEKETPLVIDGDALFEVNERVDEEPVTINIVSDVTADGEAVEEIYLNGEPIALVVEETIDEEPVVDIKEEKNHVSEKAKEIFANTVNEENIEAVSKFARKLLSRAQNFVKSDENDERKK